MVQGFECGYHRIKLRLAQSEIFTFNVLYASTFFSVNVQKAFKDIFFDAKTIVLISYVNFGVVDRSIGEVFKDLGIKKI